jgi:AraC-like DNA-binding protein
MSAVPRTTLLLRRVVGRPVASCRVPARTHFLVERYQVLFDSLGIPPLPAPVFLVHTGGKPLAYRTSSLEKPTRSIPGLVTFVPRGVRAEVSLRGVGEGSVIYFQDERRIPPWVLRSWQHEPVTFANDVVAALARRLVKAIESGSTKVSYLRALGNALLAELQHELGELRADAFQPASRSELRVAHTAVRYIDAHLGDALSVRELAVVCGLGVTTFSASFRSATGLPPYRYLSRARIERACELLRTSSLTVREVGELVGFPRQSHFCTAFAQERGMTPSAYRRAARGTGSGRARQPAAASFGGDAQSLSESRSTSSVRGAATGSSGSRKRQ